MPGLAAVNDPPPFTVQRVVLLDDAVTDIDWQADGSHALVGSAAGGLFLFDRQVARQHQWQGHDGGVTRVVWRPDDQTLAASAGEDGRVVLWDLPQGNCRAVLAEGNDWVEHLAWTRSGGVLAAAARKTISLWRDTESLGLWYDARRQVLAIAWAPDDRRLASAANKGLYLWRMDDAHDTHAEPLQLLDFPGAPVALAWQPDGGALAVGTQDGFLQIWCPGSGEAAARQLTMRGYPGKVSCLAWHPTLARLATAGGNDVVLWELLGPERRAQGRPLRHHATTVTALAWSPDGGWLASADRSGRLCIWSDSGELLFDRSLDREVTVLRWQPAHRQLLVGDTEGALYRVDPVDPPATAAGTGNV